MPTLNTLVNGTIPVAEDFNENFSALNNAIGSGTAITSWTTGDLPYASTTNTLDKLAAGTTGKALVMQVGAIPGWAGIFTDEITGLTVSNNVGDPTNDLDISVGAAASNDSVVSSRVLMQLTTGLTKRLDATWAVGTNQGMNASGGAIGDVTWHIFLIERPDTGVKDIAADTSPVGANISANTDPAYTKMRRIGSIPREAGALVLFDQQGERFQRLTGGALYDSTANPGTSELTVTLAVPTGLRIPVLLNATLISSGTPSAVYLRDPAVTDQAAGTSTTPLATFGTFMADAQQSFWSGTIMMDIAASIRARLNASAGDVRLYIAPIGWIDRRGRG